MASLYKMYVARFFSDDKHPFSVQKIVAKSYGEAGDIAAEWAGEKYTDRRIRDIVIERSKGEVVA